jgi:hypothetical protein
VARRLPGTGVKARVRHGRGYHVFEQLLFTIVTGLPPACDLAIKSFVLLTDGQVERRSLDAYRTVGRAAAMLVISKGLLLLLLSY